MMRLIGKIVAVIASIIVFLYLLLWAFSPSLFLYQANKILPDFGYTLAEQSTLRFNPFEFKLSIDDLVLQDKTGEVQHVFINQGHIDISALAFLQHSITIESLELNEAGFDIERSAELFKIAGYALSSDSTPADTNEDEAAATATDWTLDIRDLRIEKLSTNVSDLDGKHTVTLEDLHLFAVHLGLAKQTGSLQLEARINDAEVTGEISFDLEQVIGDIAVALKIEALNPKRFHYLFDDYLQGIDGNLRLETEQTLTLLNEGIALQVHALALNAEQLSTQHEQAHATLESLRLNASDGTIRLNNKGLESLSITPQIGLTELSLTQGENQAIIASLGAMESQDLSVRYTPENDWQAALGALSFKNLLISKPISAPDIATTPPALFELPSMSINKVSATGREASIQSIELSAFDSYLALSEQGELANLYLPAKTASAVEDTSEPAETEKQSTVTPDADKTANYQFELGQMTIAGPSKVQIIDRSVTPAFNDLITIKAVQVGNVISNEPSHATPFSMKFQSDEYSSGEVVGQIQLFAERLNLSLKSTLQEFSLPKISPYVRKAAGFDLLAGQFDITSEVHIIDDQLEGKNALNLRGIELESANDVKSGKLVEQSFIPLNLALGALKDGDGNIEMDVALSGDIHDPDIGLNGFIYKIAQKAALAALESYAINTFVPYANIVSLAKVAGSYALKVRIEDLVYEAKQIAPAESQAEFISNLGILMQQKPDLQIKLCPIAVKEDFQEGEANLSDAETIAKLKNIADQRAQALKAALIKNEQVSSSRLLLCQGRVDARDDAKPRIEFSI